MHPTLARGLLRLQESFLGRSTFAQLEALQADDSPPADVLREMQIRKLREILAHARAAVPYWQQRLSSSPPHSATAPADLLTGVPILTRTEIRRHLETLRWPEAPGKLLQHRSGGTTDDNLTFYWSRERQSWDRATRYRGFARLGVAPGDRVLHLWPCYPAPRWSDALRLALRQARDWLTNDVVFDLRPLTPEALDAGIALCRRYRPHMIIGYPSWLSALARRVREAHPGYSLPGLRVTLCTGEALFAFQSRLLRETLQAPVVQEYGSQDAGLIAHEDLHGAFRLHAEQMFVEVLREGRPAAPGELGEVVITHFHNRTMPFLRYATGDVMRQFDGPVLCPVPEGRTSDQLATADGRVCPMRPVVESLVEEVGLEEFSLYQPAVGSVTVLHVADAARPVRQAATEDVLRRHLGRPLVVTWSAGRGFVPLTSGKRRFVCSPAALELLAHDRTAGAHLARAWPQRLVGGDRASAPATPRGG